MIIFIAVLDDLFRWPERSIATKAYRVMSFWTRNPSETDAEVAESLSHSPSGGRVKMWLLGVALALLPLGYGIHCLWTGHTTFYGSHAARLDLTGSEAAAMAAAYIAVGVFIHAHWFWGLHSRLEPFSPILKVLAIATFLGGLGYVGYKIMSF